MSSNNGQRSGFWITRIRMHHWHEFTDCVINIPLGVGLHLEGDQGVGKSTILDALQLVLVADERQVKFNASAGEGVDRYVSDYVRCLTPKGYLREQGIAHILVEFVNFKTHKVVTVGVVIEYDGSEKPRKLFLIAEAPCELDLVMSKEGEGYVPLDHHELRKYAQVFESKGTHYAVTEGIIDYRHRFQARFGMTPDRFFLIITRLATQEFDGRIDRLIPSLVFEEDQAITGLDDLRQRVLEMRKTGKQLEDAENHLKELRNIAQLHQEWEQADLESKQYRACLLKYQTDCQIAEIELLQREIERGNEDQARHIDQLATLNADFKEADQKRSNADRNRYDGNTQAEIKQLEIGQELLEKSLASIQVQSQKHRDAEAQLMRWFTGLGQALPQIQSIDAQPVPAHILEMIATPEVLLTSRQAAADAVGEIRDWLSDLRARIQQQIDQNHSDLIKRRQEFEQLSQGRIPNQNAYKVKAQLEKAGLGPINILFDLVDDVDPAWQGIIEQVVGGRRFTLVMPENQYQEALHLFRAMNPYDTHGVYLVRPQDVRSNQRTDSRSLAVKVSTRNALVRGLLNIHLRTQVDEDEKRAEKASNGVITRSGYSVGGGTDHRQRPLEESEWVFGSKARQARREALAKAIADIETAVDQLNAYREDIHQILANTGAMARSVLDFDPELLQKEAESRTQLEKLSIRINELKLTVDWVQLEEAYQRAARYCREIDQQIGKLGERLQSIEKAQATRQNSLSQARNSLNELERQMEALGQVSGWAELYDDLLLRQLSKQQMEQVVNRLDQDKTNAANQTRNTLVTTVNRYITTRYPHQGLLPDQEKIVMCMREYHQLEDMEVVELRARHAKVVAQADQNLKHLFVDKLRAQIDLIQTTIHELSKTTQGIFFGARQYRFAPPRPNPNNPPLIRDLLSMLEDYRKKNEFFVPDILELLRQDWGEVIEKLYRVLVPDDIVLTNEDQSARSMILFPVRYFTYDLQFREQRSEQWHDMSKSISKGSGGERQSPYYVVVIAAMMHVYSNHPDRPRLILLDEAFAKAPVSALSGLGLVNEVGLQPIVATPLGSVAAEQAIGYTLRLYKTPEGRRFLVDETKEAYRRAGLSRENFLSKSSVTAQ